MICKHCKAENEDGALFCSSCGKPLEDEEYDREKMRGEYEAVYRNIYRAYDISGKWSGVWILLFQ